MVSGIAIGDMEWVNVQCVPQVVMKDYSAGMMNLLLLMRISLGDTLDSRIMRALRRYSCLDGIEQRGFTKRCSKHRLVYEEVR